jgi:hypothetical protein
VQAKENLTFVAQSEREFFYEFANCKKVRAADSLVQVDFNAVEKLKIAAIVLRKTNGTRNEQGDT